MLTESVNAAARSTPIQSTNARASQHASGDPVQDAADQIERLLNSKGAFQWVDSGEVMDVNNILAGLDSQTANAVIDELDQRGLLDTFMAEMVDSSNVGGGVSDSERQTIFANLARKLDGESLVKVQQALSETRDGPEKVKWVNEFSQAIGTHATSSIKADFVEGMKQYTTDETDLTNNDMFFGGSSFSTFEGDPDALAVANVLGSMEYAGAYRDRALSSLSDSEFKAVVDASIRQQSRTTTAGMSSSTSISFDAASFTNLANTVAASNDVGRKADFIEYGGQALKEVRDSGSPLLGVVSLDKDETVDAMLGAMTKVMDSDTSKIVETLATHAENKFGEGLASYAKSMLESGDAGKDKLAEQLNAIKYGNDGNGNLNNRLAREDSDGDRPVAAALGYFAGAVWAGAESITKDKQKQADLITDVLVTAANLHPASAAASEFIDDAINAVAQKGGNIGAEMYRQLLPTDANGKIAVDADIQDTVHTRYADVAAHANP